MGNVTPLPPSPRDVLKQLRLTSAPEEHSEVAKLDLLPVSDRVELLFRMMNRLSQMVAKHGGDFALIDLAFREQSEAIHQLQRQAEAANDRGATDAKA